MSHYYIYRITNTTTGRLYIGQTNDPKQRWAQYRSAMKETLPSQLITRSMKKHGEDKFLFEVILTCRTREDANHQETYVIAQYNATDLTIGYNIDYGGGAEDRNESTGRKISFKLKAYYKVNKHWAKGREMPEYHRQAIAIASVGKPGTNTGKTFDQEWTAKQSKAHTGKSQSHRRKFSDEQEKEMCDLYVSGLSAKKVGIHFSVPSSTVLGVLKRNKIPSREGNAGKRKPALSTDQELALCTDYKSGNFSRSSLAKKYGCGTTTARDILIRNGYLKEVTNE